MTARQLASLCLGLVCTAGAAAACSCRDLTPCMTVTHAEVLARVRVTSGPPTLLYSWVRHQESRVEVEVIEVLKPTGEAARHAVVASPFPMIGSCAISLESGREYLLVAVRDGDVWRTNVCSGTRPWDGAVAEREWLKQDRQDIFGELPDSSILPNKYSYPVHVLLSSGDETRWALTDDDGRFEFENVPVGTYRLRALGKTITVPVEKNDCPYVSFPYVSPRDFR